MGVIIKIIDYGDGIKTFGKGWIAFIPGVIILVLAGITGEKIGFGDGWLVIILGNFMSIVEIIRLLQLAIILTFMFSVIILCGKKATKTYQIPFLPFLWLSHLFLWRLGYV